MTHTDFEDVESRWLSAMRRGDFEEAWCQTDRIEIERRAQDAAGTFLRRPDHLLWNGQAFDGREVLVRCNHGLGDTLQFIRYVPLLCRLARGVSVLVQPQLLALLRGCAGLGRICNGWSEGAPCPHDVEIEIMELAYAFRSTVDTLPRRVPYLCGTHIEEHAARLPRSPVHDGLHVGLLWAASEWDSSRSIPLELLEPLAYLPRVQFHSLQQDAHADLGQNAPFRINPLSRHTSDVLGAAAAMSRLDLVITVDSMAAHLAGALACPVWVLLKHDADWRWLATGSYSPWYPTMRLFRQRAAGDWPSAAQAVADALHAAATPSRAATSA